MPTRAQMSAVENQGGGHTQLVQAALAGDLKIVKMSLKRLTQKIEMMKDMPL